MGYLRVVDSAVLLIFIAIFFVQLAHHQMWRDELNAWGIAVASPSLKALFANIHYEGHPSLWYLMLWFISRWTTSPVAMKLLQAMIGAAIYLMIGLRSPFSRLEKVLLYLSYFVSFEYTVFSRTYGVCFLLLLVYLYQRNKHPERVVANTALIGLVANTDVLGIILSGALLVEYAIDRVQAQRLLRMPPLGRLYAAALTYLLFLGISVETLRPAADISWRTTGHMFDAARSVRHLADVIVSYIALPWFPISGGFPRHYWNPLAIDHFRLYLLALPVVCCVGFLLFRRDRNLLLMLVLTAAGSITFAHLVYFGSMRHYGIMFMAFLAALWIQRSHRPGVPMLGILLLVLNAIGGVGAAYGEWHHPFSNATAVANWLSAHPEGKLPLVGTPDTSIAGIAELARRPAYFLDCSCTGTFLLFSSRRDHFSVAQVPQRLTTAARDLHAPEMLFVTDHALSPGEGGAIAEQGFRIALLAGFTGAEAIQEDFFLYKLTKTT